MFFRDELADVGDLSELLEWGAPIAGPTPYILQNKNGTYQVSLAYQGHDVTMLAREAHAAYMQQLNTLLMRFGTHWCLHFDEWYEPSVAYPQSTWRNPTACFVDALREAAYGQGALHTPAQFLTLTWAPSSQGQQKLYEAWLEDAKPAGATRQVEAERFAMVLERWIESLKGVLPSATWLDQDGTETYLMRCVTWRRHAVRAPLLATHTAARLACDDWLPGNTPQLGRLVVDSDPPRLERFLRPIGIQSWPEHTVAEGGGLSMDIPRLLQSRVTFPYRYVVRYKPLDIPDAEKALKSQRGRWKNMLEEIWSGPLGWVQPFLPSGAQLQIDSIDRALHSMRAGDVHYGYSTPVVLVWGETMEELTYREREILAILDSEGCVSVPETTNASQAWLSMQPGDLVHNARVSLLPSLGVGFLAPHSTKWIGDRWDQRWQDEPLFLASSDGSPFWAALHPGSSAIGSWLILGPSQTGKTGLQGLMASQFQRYAGAQVFGFDKDYGLEVSTALHGGSYYDLGKDKGHGIHPFGQIHTGLDEQRWALEWVNRLLLSQGETLDAEDREQMWLALQRLTSFAPSLRTLSGFQEVLQVPRLKQTLAPYCLGGPYAFFDASVDDVVLADWTVFEMSGLLEFPEALPHVLRYRFHRMESRFGHGRKTLILLSEVHRLLKDPTFVDEVIRWIKERAKLDVSVELDTQDVYDLSESTAWHALKNNVETLVFLPNVHAMDQGSIEFYRMAGLTDQEIHLLTVSTPKQDYLFKSGRHARRVQILLSPMERLLLAASGDMDRERFATMRLEQLKEPLTAAWLRRNDFGDMADIFVRDYAPKETL